MAVPTTNVTFSSIQTEFGGANPISLSAEYYRGGTYVNSGQTTSVTDGVAIPTAPSTLIRVGMFRGLTKTAAGGPTSEYNASAYSVQGGGGSGLCRAQITFQTNGAIVASRGGTGAMFTASTDISNTVNGKRWYSPTTTGIGSSYWVRATKTSDPNTSLLGASYGTWINLTADTTWYLQFGDNSQVTGRITFDISASSGGSVLATGYIDLLGQSGTF